MQMNIYTQDRAYIKYKEYNKAVELFLYINTYILIKLNKKQQYRQKTISFCFFVFHYYCYTLLNFKIYICM